MTKLIVALTIAALTLTAPSAFAAPGAHRKHGFSGGHPGAFVAHRGFEGHRDFDRDHHSRVFVSVGPSFYWGPAYPYAWGYPPAAAYVPPPQSYWYYCPSMGAYYPYVSSCPEAWVPVPATPQ